MDKLTLLQDHHLMELERFLNSEDHGNRKKAIILLGFAAGKDVHEIAADVDLSVSRVYYWRRAYLKHGMDIFDTPEEKENAPEEETSIQQSPADEEQTQGQARIDAGESAPLPVAEIQQVYSVDLAQTAYVRKLALRIFDETVSCHKMGERSRKLLETCAGLYPLGSYMDVHRKDAIDFSFPQVSGFDAVEQLYLSAILRNLSGKINRAAIAMLSTGSQVEKEILTLIVLLRMAIRLNESASQSTEIDEILCTSSRLMISVHGPFAGRDVSAARKEAKIWRKLWGQALEWVFPPVEQGLAEAEEQEMTLPKPTDKPGIKPDDTMAEACRKLLRFQFARMLSHEAGTIAGDDIEELHDMRVATRRMRAAFDVFKGAFVANEIQPYIKGLRATGKALGRVRDLDVFIQKTQKYIDNLPEEDREGLRPLLDSWQEQREIARQKMVETLQSEKYKRFKIQFGVFVNTAGMGVKKRAAEENALGLVRHSAPMLIYTQFSSVRSFGEIMQNPTLEQLHALRIRFKKFRYSVEFFREVLGDSAKDVIGDIKRMQDHLGNLNDADVACKLLNRFIRNWEASQNALPISERVNPEPIVAYLAAKHAERYRLMISFPKEWAYFTRPDFRKNLAQAVSVL